MSTDNGESQEPLSGLAREHVPPQVVDVSYEFKVIPVPGGQQIIAFEIHMPTGVTVTFWGPQSLQKLGKKALETAEPLINGLAVVEKQIWIPGHNN